MSIWSDLGNAFTTIGDTVADPFVKGYQVTATTMESAERAVVDQSLRIGNAVTNLGMVVGDGVVSAANIVGQGVVTFGTDVQKFSISGGGAIVDWTKTTAGEVQSWSRGTAGNISAFSQSAYAAAKRDCLLAASFVAANGAEWAAYLASLFTSKLPKLGGYDSTARSIANILFPGLAGTIEDRARSDGTTIGFDFKLTFGALNPRVGLYVDSTGQWGFYDTLQLTLGALNLDTSNLTSVSGTVEVITVFGPRDAFSERAVVALGGTIRGVYGGIGASVYITSRGHFVGFRVQVSLGFASSSIAPGEVEVALVAPKPNGEALALGVNQFNKSMSDAGPSWEAATRALLSPDQEARIVATAAAATLSPFKPRYCGTLRTGDAQPLSYYIDWSAGAAPSNTTIAVQQSATPPQLSTWRIVSGLSDKNLISIEIMIFGVPFYLSAGDGGPVLAMRYSAQYSDMSSFQVIPAVSGATNAISLLSKNGFLVGGNQNCLTLSSPLTDAQKRALSFVIDQPATLSDPQQTSSLGVGEVLRVGQFRRSGDGRAFLTLQANGSLATALGSGPGDSRGAVWNSPPSTAAGPFYAVMQPSGSLAVFQGAGPSSSGAQVWASDVLGTPGGCFASVTNDGNLVVFQGSTDKPGELIYSSVSGAARWAKSRRPRVAIRTFYGHYWSSLKAANVESTSYSTSLYATTKGIGQGEVFCVETLYDGRLAFRTTDMHYVRAYNGGGSSLDTAAERPLDWESFTPEYLPNGQVTLRAFHGQFVCAQNGGGDVVNAARTSASDWETFTFVDVPGPLGVLYPPDDPAAPRSSRTVALRTCYGSYWSAQNGGGSTLSAAAVDPRSWEIFELQERRNGQIALRAGNGQYVSATGPSSTLVVNKNTIGPMESFDVTTPSQSYINLCAGNGQFVCADNGGGGSITADRTKAAEWEAFTILNVRDAFGWERVDPIEALTLNSAPAVVVAGSRMMVFFRGADNALYHKTYDGSRWLPAVKIGGNLTGSVCALNTPGTSKITTFHRGTAGTYSCWNDGTNADWHLWGQLGGSAVCGPAASSWGDGIMDVFSTDGSGALIHTYWWNGAWTPWESLGKPGLTLLNAPPAATSWSPGNIQVIGRSTSSSASSSTSYDMLWAKFNTNLHWGEWSIIDPQCVNVTSGPTVVSRGAGLLDVFARGTDYGLYHIAYANGAWGSSERLGGQLTSTPSAVIYKGNIHVFARGADNGLIRIVL